MREFLQSLLAATALLAAAAATGCGGQTVERPDQARPMMKESKSAVSPEPPPLPSE